MTTPLILESLEVRGLRAFNHLLIERLAHVNLIVGKNNVGKTALLEALRLYVFRGSPEIIWEILEVHDERKRPWLSAGSIDGESLHPLTDTRGGSTDWPSIKRRPLGTCSTEGETLGRKLRRSLLARSTLRRGLFPLA